MVNSISSGLIRILLEIKYLIDLSIFYFSSASKAYDVVARITGDNVSRPDIDAMCDNAQIRVEAYASWLRVSQLKSQLMVKLPGDLMTNLAGSLSKINQKQALEIHPVGGAIVAVPHFGEFVVDIISIALSAPPKRKVAIFYDPPTKSVNNSVFDDIAQRVIPTLDKDIIICHNDPRGLAVALKILRGGGTVIIMPDICQDQLAAFTIPFFLRDFDVMLGVARLSIKTDVKIVPVLPRTLGWRKKIKVLKAISVVDAQGSSAATSNELVDYTAIREIFHQYEAGIGKEIIFWRYWHKHFHQKEFVHINNSEDFTALISLDPLLKCHRRACISRSIPITDNAYQTRN